MAKTLVQKVVFENTTPEVLYDLYTNAEKHSQVIGVPTEIADKEETTFSAGGGYIRGKNLKLVKNELIVQNWRAANWDEKDGDSTLVILLKANGKDVELNLVHTNVPEKFIDEVNNGWNTFYWDRWKAHLAGKPVPKAAVM